MERLKNNQRKQKKKYLFIIFLIFILKILCFYFVKLLYLYKFVQNSKWLKFYMNLMGQSYRLNVSILISGLISYIPML